MNSAHLPHRKPASRALPTPDDREVIMRTIIRIFAPVVLFLAMLLPSGGAVAAPAETERQDTFAVYFNTCNGDFVEVTGKFHIVSKQQKDGTFLQHAIIHGQGVGTQGEYVLNYKTNYRSEFPDFSFQERTALISKGSAPNQVILVHVTEDGLVQFDTECRG